MAAFCVSTTTPAPVNKKTNAQCDASVLARARAGDEDAFSTLYSLYKRRVFSLCLRMTGDVVTAEDLTQEAFLQVFRKLKTFRGDSAFFTWLYRVSVNAVLMYLRRRKPEHVSLDEPMEEGSVSLVDRFGHTDPELSATVDRMALIRAINELPEGYRTIFILHDIEGYEHKEIAQILECSTGNSKSQLHKARMKLRQLLRGRSSLRLAVQPVSARTISEKLVPISATERLAA